MVDRAISVVLCAGLGLLGGVVAGGVILAVYLLAILLLGTGISQTIPILVERITVPLGILAGTVIALVAE